MTVSVFNSHISAANFPALVIVNIFDFLDLNDKKNGRLTCRRWMWALGSPVSLRFEARISDNHLVQRLMAASVYFETLEFKNLAKTVFPSMTLSRNKFPRTRAVKIGPGNSDANVNILLKYCCANAQRFAIQKLAFANVKLKAISHLVPKLGFTFLTELCFEISRIPPVPWMTTKRIKDLDKHSDAVECFLKLGKAPALKKLIAKFVFDCCKGRRDQDFEKLMIPRIADAFLHFLKFIARHTKTLEGLELDFFMSTYLPINIVDLLVNSMENKFSNELLESIKSEFKMNSLTITSDSPMLHLLASSILEITTVRTMTWTCVSHDHSGSIDYDGLRLLHETILRNQSTLTSLSVDCFEEGGTFDMVCLKCCTGLVTLSLWAKMIGSQDVQIPTLKNFTFAVLPPIVLHTSEWIAQAFNNVNTVQLVGWWTDYFEIKDLRILLGLPKFKQLEYGCDTNRPEAKQILDFCSCSSGLTLEDTPGRGYIMYSYRHNQMRTIRKEFHIQA